MKKMWIFGLVLASSTAFAAPASYDGVYRAPSNVRVFDYTQEECVEENGTFHSEDQSCSLAAQNTISVRTNQQGQRIVKINVIFGAAHTRDFSGVITRTFGDLSFVEEAEIDDDGIVSKVLKNGCTLKIAVKESILSLDLGKNCDPELGRANGAQKK